MLTIIMIEVYKVPILWNILYEILRCNSNIPQFLKVWSLCSLSSRTLIFGSANIILSIIRDSIKNSFSVGICSWSVRHTINCREAPYLIDFRIYTLSITLLTPRLSMWFVKLAVVTSFAYGLFRRLKTARYRTALNAFRIALPFQLCSRTCYLTTPFHPTSETLLTRRIFLL